MTPLLDRNLIYVTGKGGVGRSTVAAALGLAAAARGRRTILCEVAEQDRLSRVFKPHGIGAAETELAEGLWGVSVDPHEALKEWLRKQLGSAALFRVLFDNSAFQYFVAAAPGARELITIAKVWEIAQPERWSRGNSTYDLVVVDAPASGHGLAMLRTPRTFAEIARVGPIRRQADKVRDFLHDPDRTGYVAVALPEEMPVSETLELQGKLTDQVGVQLDAVVVNGVYPQRYSAADVAQLEEAASDGASPEAHAALHTALSEHRRARGQQNQLRRMRRGADGKVVSLPFVFAEDLGRDELELLGRELGKKLSR
jgi:anion-transporting  ArsA/GET3 family ATPase